jgi:protein TonB
MFDQLVLSATTRKRTRGWLYFTVTAAVWMMALTTTIIGGIFAFDARLNDQFKALAPVILPPIARLGVERPQQANYRQHASRYVTPKTPPVGITPPSSKPPDIAMVNFSQSGTGDGPAGGPYGVKDGVIGGQERGIPHAIATVAAPPPPPETRKVEPAAPPVKAQTIIRQVSTVLQGTAIRRVQPVYPPLARNARIGGQVVVEVTIDEGGNVIQARALSGHALLKQVSLDAARGWKWRPTLLNNIPVKVIGTITFNFLL